MGLVYTSDAVTSTGVQLLLRPRSEATVARYWAVVPESAPSGKQSAALLDFLLSSAARRRLRLSGFQPVREGIGRQASGVSRPNIGH
ncbi:MAG: substrate-binding domain-containing protein [Pirellulales bacterium]